MPEITYPWETAYREAVLEFSPQLLPGKMVAAEKAIYDRMQEVSNDGSHQKERLALDDALFALRVLKSDDLKQTTK